MKESSLTLDLPSFQECLGHCFISIIERLKLPLHFGLKLFNFILKYPLQ